MWKFPKQNTQFSHRLGSSQILLCPNSAAEFRTVCTPSGLWTAPRVDSCIIGKKFEIIIFEFFKIKILNKCY